MEPLLEVKNLKTSFKIGKKWVPAVEQVCFHVDPGETLGIVGESGCGKSVTSMSIMRLLPKATTKIEADEIILNGKNIANYSDKEMAQVRGTGIGMIFQDSMTSLNPVKTIGKQLDEAFIVHHSCDKNEAKNRSIEMLTKVGIPSPEKRYGEYPHQLSGGMRQRVMIAMALSCQPSLLIADEPTTALDVTIQAQIMNLLRSLKRELRMSLLLITHDMGLVAQMADRVMVMYAGQIIEEGTVFEIFDHPSHPYTKALLAAVPSMEQNPEEMLQAIEGTVPENYGQMTGCRFRDRCPYRKQGCEAPQELEEIKAEETQKAQELHRVRCWRAKEAEQSGRTL